METGIRPFDCGLEYAGWTTRNCDRCTKGDYYDEQGEPTASTCAIALALDAAYWGDGTVEEAIAWRMNLGIGACSEFIRGEPEPPAPVGEDVRMRRLGAALLPGLE